MGQQRTETDALPLLRVVAAIFWTALASVGFAFNVILKSLTGESSSKSEK